MKGRHFIEKQINKSRSLIKRGLECLKEEGTSATMKKVVRRLGLRGHITPKQWAKTPLYSKEELELQRHYAFDKDIKFSIITPLYNTPKPFLIEMIESVIAQTYSNWELCMADGSSEGFEYVEIICNEYAGRDKRIKYKKLTDNYGIVGNSNKCLDMSTGEYIALLDHDDVLHPAALYDVMKVICECDADFIYTDEMIFDSPNISDIRSIHCKPDYAIDNLRANNYICHLSVFKDSLLKKCGKFRDGFDGAQDHELILRLTASAKCIKHIPKALYYWRSHKASTAADESNKPYASEAGKKAVKSVLESEGYTVQVESARDEKTRYRISYEIHSPEPKVSIIIPNYNHKEDLEGCLESIVQKTQYINYEVIVVENNSTDSEIFAYYDELTAKKNGRVQVVKWPGKGFNWSAINNYAVREVADGEYILLLNNDVEVINAEWIEEMLMFAQRPDVGAVGAMLYYPDDTIQHAGVIVGMRGTAGHKFKGFRRGSTGYKGNLCYAHNLSAVTGACMMLRRNVFDEVGGIDEQFAVGWNDIDLCLRIRELGYLIVWTPFAELYHYESKSRGKYDDTLEKQVIATRETKLFQSRWSEILEKGDPYYNPNLSLKYGDYSLKQKDE